MNGCRIGYREVVVFCGRLKDQVTYQANVLIVIVFLLNLSY